MTTPQISEAEIARLYVDSWTLILGRVVYDYMIGAVDWDRVESTLEVLKRWADLYKESPDGVLPE